MFNRISSALGGFALSNLFRRLVTMSVREHSQSITCNYDAMKVVVMPALQDNYMYLLIDTVSNEAAIVDPVDPASVTQRVFEENVVLTTVLTTHHHWDHAGGNVELVAKMKGNKLTVVGGDDRVGAVSKIITDGDELKLGSLTIKSLHTPCHTTGHICYYVTGPKAKHPIVFTGDTLFIAGCGRFFEGTPEMMNAALNEKLASLPDDTQVFCGHEYTLTNLKFAVTVEPQNKDILKKLQDSTDARINLLPTVPSTIGEEKETNPFMRVAENSVQSYARAQNAIQTMAYVRKQKDSFKA